jgi:hypothetical protein
MNELLEIKERDSLERQIFFLPLSSLESLPLNLRLPTPHFVLFLACNASKITTDSIYDFAQKIVEMGAVYVCSWGKDCELTHEIFDEFLELREAEEVKQLPHIMTTWHTNDSLDEALWFALNVAYPDSEFAESCGSTLIVSVANERWNAHLQKRLSNLRQFNQELVNAD